MPAQRMDSTIQGAQLRGAGETQCWEKLGDSEKPNEMAYLCGVWDGDKWAEDSMGPPVLSPLHPGWATVSSNWTAW